MRYTGVPKVLPILTILSRVLLANSVWGSVQWPGYGQDDRRQGVLSCHEQDKFLFHRVQTDPRVNTASYLAGVEPLCLTIKPPTLDDNQPVASNA
jgi:hypothetical protein